eukprot:6198379-Pleurochrysis_carterae.AAC.1
MHKALAKTRAGGRGADINLPPNPVELSVLKTKLLGAAAVGRSLPLAVFRVNKRLSSSVNVELARLTQHRAGASAASRGRERSISCGTLAATNRPRSPRRSCTSCIALGAT